MQRSVEQRVQYKEDQSISKQRKLHQQEQKTVREDRELAMLEAVDRIDPQVEAWWNPDAETRYMGCTLLLSGAAVCQGLLFVRDCCLSGTVVCQGFLFVRDCCCQGLLFVRDFCLSGIFVCQGLLFVRDCSLPGTTPLIHSTVFLRSLSEMSPWNICTITMQHTETTNNGWGRRRWMAMPVPMGRSVCTAMEVHWEAVPMAFPKIPKISTSKKKKEPP